MAVTASCQEQLGPEPPKIFDTYASVRMFEEDQANYGFIRDETLSRVYGEELSFVAEGMDKPFITKFQFKRGETGLVDERGRDFKQMLSNGIAAAEALARSDNRYKFMLERVVNEHQEGIYVDEMMSGQTQENTTVSLSAFPEEALHTYGDADMLNEVGFNVSRKLGFIRICHKQPDGSMEMVSISVDNSDLDAFRSVMLGLGVIVPEELNSTVLLSKPIKLQLGDAEYHNLPEKLLGIYDGAMATMYGGEFKAGRPKTGNEVDAWQFISRQEDLVSFYLDGIEKLALSGSNQYELRKQKTILTYSFWAALKERLKVHESGLIVIPKPMPSSGSVTYHLDQHQLEDRLNAEMTRALERARNRGDQLIGCGGRIEAPADLLEMGPEEARSTIFNEKKETWVWKEGVCRVEKCPTRPGKTKVGPCHVCQRCQTLFDKGKDPTK